MALRVPMRWLPKLSAYGLFRRPDFLAVEVADAPETLEPGLVYHEVRGGHPKWAHLVCPKCGEHIQLQTAQVKTRWSIRIDWLNRPSIHPSIWEKKSCGAHFFVTHGRIKWI